jgi:biopolymer transport protein ExbD
MWVRNRKAKGEILDITPLVDLVFLLIIFFLLSTTFRVSPGIKIDLPSASSQKIQTEKKEVTVSVDKSGTVYVNKDAVDPASLLSRLMVCAQEDRDTTVLIKGDREAGFGRIVDLLDTVRQTGLHRIAIVTRNRNEPANPSEPAVTK